MISVVIPCRNEVKHIAECIDAIYASKLDAVDLEVLVVDGMSDDGTIEELNRLKIKYPSLSIVPNLLKVTPVAFNLGIKASKGDIIQIIGARQIISSNYLAEAYKSLLDNPEIHCVGGVVINVYQNAESERIGLAMGSTFGVGAGNFRVIKKSEFTDTVGTPMYRRSLFDEIGYFNEALLRNQDDEFNYRITKLGRKILLNADITIKYYVRASVKNLFKQYYQYGYWKVFVNRMHKTVTTLRQLVPAIFVLGLFIGFILCFAHPFFIGVYISVLLIYAVAAIAAGYAVAKDISKGLKVALIFPVLHFSYGWGYLKGLLDFVMLRKNPANSSSDLSR